MFDPTAFLAPVGILTVIFWGLTTIIRILKEASIKKRMIELGHLESEKQWILEKSTTVANTYSNLKYGILFVCVGIGFIAIRNLSMEQDALTVLGLVAILAGFGFLIYFMIMKYIYKKAD
jgi:hypothetical protein